MIKTITYESRVKMIKKINRMKKDFTDINEIDATLKDLKHTPFSINKTVFQYTKCRHYTINKKRVPKALYMHKILNYEKICELSQKPYVTVKHIESGRMYQLNRGYNLLPDVIPQSTVVQTWEAWTPSRDNQKPEWSHSIPDHEFIAKWHFK